MSVGCYCWRAFTHGLTLLLALVRKLRGVAVVDRHRARRHRHGRARRWQYPVGARVVLRWGFNDDMGVNDMVQVSPWVFALGAGPFFWGQRTWVSGDVSEPARHRTSGRRGRPAGGLQCGCWPDRDSAVATAPCAHAVTLGSSCRVARVLIWPHSGVGHLKVASTPPTPGTLHRMQQRVVGSSADSRDGLCGVPQLGVATPACGGLCGCCRVC